MLTRIFSKPMKHILIRLIAVLLLLATPTVHAERIKDLVSIAGVRSNQVIGYGLVVGLDGTGDSERFTTQSLRNMLQRLGVTLPEGVIPKSKNIAAVAIHGDLPPFSRPGQQIDITVSTLGSAKSLRGGSLLMTPLKGVDGQVYAVAQGNLVVGGFSVSGGDGSGITVGTPTVARIPGGAIVEKASPNPFADGEFINLSLHKADFTTMERLASSINQAFGPGTGRPIDGGTMQVSMPVNSVHRVSFISLLENLEVAPAESAARIVINARTGTVVVGQHVKVSAAAISHGTLSVTITEKAQVSQPGPLSDGTTAVVPQSDIKVEQKGGRMVLFEPGVELADLVQAVNRVGAAPDDLVAILQALHEVGALRAELVII